MGCRTINGPSTPTTETASTAQPRFRTGPGHEQPRNKIQQGIPPYGAQSAPRVNADVGTKEMNIRNIAAVIWALCLIGCATPPPTAPITEDKALAIVMDILRSRDAMPKDYEHTVEWATNHWSIFVDEIEYDDNGERIKTIGNDPRLIYLYPDGKLLAILNGGKSTREELIRWEDNLRKLDKNE